MVGYPWKKFVRLGMALFFGGSLIAAAGFRDTFDDQPPGKPGANWRVFTSPGNSAEVVADPALGKHSVRLRDDGESGTSWHPMVSRRLGDVSGGVRVECDVWIDRRVDSPDNALQIMVRMRRNTPFVRLAVGAGDGIAYRKHGEGGWKGHELDVRVKPRQWTHVSLQCGKPVTGERGTYSLAVGSGDSRRVFTDLPASRIPENAAWDDVAFLLGTTHGAELTACIDNVSVSQAAGTASLLRSARTLSDTWRVQPAQKPGIPPDPEKWEPVDLNTWEWLRWRHLIFGSNAADWTKKSNRDTIHRLWYRQSVPIPSAWKGERVFLDFRRIEGDAIVFFNGQRCREVLDPQAEVEITAQADYGSDNVLTVYVTRDYTGISRGYEHDHLRRITREKRNLSMEKWGLGVSAPVRVFTRPQPVAVRDAFVTTSWREKQVAFTLETEATRAVQGLAADIRILDADGNPAHRLSQKLGKMPSGRHTAVVSDGWKDPVPWQLEDGYLYTAVVRLRDRSGQVVDEYPPFSFGFREVWREGRSIILNGRKIRFRLGWEKNLTLDTLGMFRAMGQNVFEFQPNPTLWWANWHETPIYDHELLDALDARGCGVIMPVPGVGYLIPELLQNESVRKQYEHELELWLRRYRNRPSILVWANSMNCIGNLETQKPTGMGQSDVVRGTINETTVNLGFDILRDHDDTRLVLSHSGGNIGDISSVNQYLNFAPLQEREEWPMVWAESGDLPYSAVELGQPADRNYWKGRRFLMTEYFAMYFGDEAYLTETEQGLRKTMDYGLARTGKRVPAEMRWRSGFNHDEFPIFWEFHRLFVTQTDRSWRTWGINGGLMYWDHGLNYGFPKDQEKLAQGKYPYRFLEGKVEGRPEWANRNFDIHAENRQPLLATVAGHPRHTFKTHAFYSDETIRKQVAVVWDGPGTLELSIRWQAALKGADNPVATGKERIQLEPGDITFRPIQFQAPSVSERDDLTLSMTAESADGHHRDADQFPIQLFPRPEPLQLDARIVVHDPGMKSSEWLQGLGVEFEQWQKGMALTDVDLLILGREAVQLSQPLPYTRDDIAQGLRVLVLEQSFPAWEGMGLETIETMPRYVFKRDPASPVLAGIRDADLVNWRGSPDLLPAKEQARFYDIPRVTKWTNSHAVASIALRIPQKTGFRPLLVCEFDNDYSPLMRWRYGSGAVWFSSLDFSGRVGQAPAATRLARNLLQHAAGPVLSPTRTTYYEGNESGKALLKRLGVAIAGNWQEGSAKRSVLVLGPESDLDDEVQAFARDGGVVIGLPRSAEELKDLGFSVRKRSLVRAFLEDRDEPLLRAVGPNLLRWRDPMELVLFDAKQKKTGWRARANGAFLVRNVGEGRILLSQIDLRKLAERYENDAEKREAGIGLSVARLRQLYARILENAAATAAEPVATRLTTLQRASATYQQLGFWQVCGPFRVANSARGINAAFPCHDDAVSGYIYPDVKYHYNDRQYDWRGTVGADEDGFVNLADQLDMARNAVAYMSREIEVDESRTARLYMGFDWFFKVWLNGEPLELQRTTHGRRQRGPREFRADVKLRPGKNILTVKLGAGSNGFGFWASISEPGVDMGQLAQPAEGADLYPLTYTRWHPYEYHHY